MSTNIAPNTVGNSDFLPVILGGDFAAYSIARAFHEEYGIRSLAVCTVSAYLNKYTDIMETIVEPDLTEKDVFVEMLKGIAEKFGDGRKLILFGARDWNVRMICENHDELDKHYIVPYISEELLNRMVLKDSFYEICDRTGVDYPATYVYDFSKYSMTGADGKEVSDFDMPFCFPVCAKPASSAEYYYTEFEGQKKAYIVKDMDELKSIIANVEDKSDYNYKFLIQDFIPGDDTNMHILTCYCDRNSKVRFVAFGHTLLEDHSDDAIGNPAVIVNDVNMDVASKAIRFLEEVGYVGYANFDIKYDSRDGKYKFFEINTRLGSSNYYVTGSGFNTVKWIVDDYVYGKEFSDEIVVADNEHMYSVVPRDTIVSYLRHNGEDELKEMVKRLYREGKVSVPIDYPADRNFIHKLYVKYYLHHQKKKFAEFI